jgi:type II secretory pathway pseudopilin PulG
MTVIAVFVAYTVPRQWSIIVARERDQQTLFAMKQYARAIKNFQEKNKSMPVSLDQLKQARQPRMIRGKGELIDPLTGQVDWIVIPASAVQGQAGGGQQQLPPGVAPNTPGTTTDPRGGMVVGYQGAPPVPSGPSSPIPGSGPSGSQPAPGSPGGTVGPIAGVRPNKTGKSYLILKGVDTYEQWVYTTVDLEGEIASARNAMMVK